MGGGGRDDKAGIGPFPYIARRNEREECCRVRLGAILLVL